MKSLKVAERKSRNNVKQNIMIKLFVSIKFCNEIISCIDSLPTHRKRKDYDSKYITTQEINEVRYITTEERLYLHFRPKINRLCINFYFLRPRRSRRNSLHLFCERFKRVYCMYLFNILRPPYSNGHRLDK